MGSLIHRKGDCFSTAMPIIAHGVNCSRGFASGFAAQVAAKFPIAKQSYLEKFDSEGWELGDIQVVDVDDGHGPLKMIVNLASQQTYGRSTGFRYVDYDGLKLGLDRVFAFAEALEWGVAMPRIGAGLGGGDWAEIETILVRSIMARQVEVEVWAP